MIRTLTSSVMLLLLSFVVAGCGQKGPLYLPSDEEAAERYGPREEAQQDEEQQPEDESSDASADSTIPADEN
ncbi:LPS translocon maturation chaperone LptM [Halomonas huangheensis]|uniref:Lipoprotein n=1 Tax=Halomonas huangheensis TaxID=1178482 RepID=W1N8H5_9GAMM|nr:lipoprotein [Halomonas huangheensis]ERL51235.1 hypothetical protein BJB45_15140 [Halomonas huangheensis]